MIFGKRQGGNMRMQDLATQLGKARLVDLSKKVSPGKVEGPVGLPARKYEIKLFKFPPGELMHYIEMESHISTHVEAPSHFLPASRGVEGDDISQIPLTSLFGMCVFVNCKELPPKTEVGREILGRFPIMAGDIVLLGNADHGGWDRCYISKEGAEYLVEKKVKMFGVDDTVFPEATQFLLRDLKSYFVHDLLLAHNIPIIEGLTNMGALRRTRFLFFGFPAMMGGLESFPIRAIAFEGEDD
jgi:arylformamidase